MPQKKKTAKRASLAQVAKLAGVHKTTASRVMRGADNVAKRTRSKVLKAAEKVGYQHSELVSTVMTSLARSRTPWHDTPIALILDLDRSATTHNVMSDELIAYAKERAGILGFKVEVFDLRAQALTSERLNSILYARGIKALVINCASELTANLQLDWSNYCVATLGGQIKSCPSLPRVQSDMIQIIGEATKNLYKRGYQRIGYCYYSHTSESLGGIIEAAIRYHTAHTDPNDRIPPLDTYSCQIGGFEEWLKTYKPDAILCHQESEYAWLTELGYKMPEDIGYAAYSLLTEDSETSGMVQHKGELAAAGVEQVVTQLFYGRSGPESNSSRILLPGHWLDSQTTRPSA